MGSEMCIRDRFIFSAHGIFHGFGEGLFERTVRHDYPSTCAAQGGQAHRGCLPDGKTNTGVGSFCFPAVLSSNDA